MNNRLGRTLTITIAALSIAAVGTASARPHQEDGGRVGKPEKTERPEKGQNGKGQNGKGQAGKSKQYNFHGTYLGAEGLEPGQVAMNIEKGNRAVRRAGLIGQTVVFDVSTARIRVADVNGDGNADLSDVQVGDTVKVKARISVGTVITQPITAWKVIDSTNPPADDSPETETPG